MNNNQTDYDYNLLASRFISDETLSIKIQNNATFVENYLDKIDFLFKEEIEKQIALREMGIIVYSCIEALLKSVLFEINKRCKVVDCGKKETCDYWKFRKLSSINEVRTIDSMLFLFDCRLFWLPPNEVNELRMLNELRNYVHISKNINKPIDDNIFTEQYVSRMLKYYYKILDQLNNSDFYFDNIKSCLAELDSWGMGETIKQNKLDSDIYYRLKINSAITNIIFEKELSEEEVVVLRALGLFREKVFEEIKDTILETLERYRIPFESESQFQRIREALRCELQKFFDRDYVNSLIKKLTKIRKKK